MRKRRREHGLFEALVYAELYDRQFLTADRELALASR